ncbi:oxidative damage protection protein [Gammaproteobacteria bacterium]|jgi:Fe-S cluster biosynthesis and repair protein YggX|nr:oxidative damage protection protein [Gammaproteobacteria bacterium]MDA8934017.1 oxidative damage protection protein [Gammaproteobacteria bacterium]MDA8955164.1 oxidative damage protection protein [Gammaproteobacteria bacterium]MDA9315449.1 oxidative damage protection protein [Gammaproteobacteria bacterium]MDA9342858.1 oxidative damage protection protein [Gammaproteobacteria bacterium]|tara:strand:- start:245 stop:514 length:270 start_codon:yes stop_codon:yes gene_type:complete
MSKNIFCKKFKEDLPSLSIPPMPGQKGAELMETISQKAWDQWRSHQTTLINEKHLDMSDSESRKWLSDQMDKFFNNEDYEKPSGFKALD